MSDKDRAKDDAQTPEITRRATFKLATAVAAFGAALGMRATSARAEGKVEIKGQSERKGEHIAKGVLRDKGEGRYTDKQTKSEGRYTDKSGTYRDSGSKQERGSGYIKLKNDKN
jgi:hypothetical protein